MLIVIDRKIPAEAKEKLSVSGTLLELETEGIVYPAISGHPDIFFCKTPQTLVVSPSLPEKYSILLREHEIQFTIGNQASSIQHPGSVYYNAAVNDRYLVHRLEHTDPVILQHCHTLKKIPVKQGYTRCNLLLLKDHHYVTSDQGIHRTLQRSGLKGIYVSPSGIVLPGFPNGFIGGAMAVLDRFIYVIGNFSQSPEGSVVREFLKDLDYSVIELYNGPLCDGGGILFL
ncbi:MAG: hypothetical protein NTW10_02805 [Bacteroidetes bacterium]|nr:hypothetical protein [Bacteroidota bacterium]